jgi:hypothetical protein
MDIVFEQQTLALTNFRSMTTSLFDRLVAALPTAIDWSIPPLALLPSHLSPNRESIHPEFQLILTTFKIPVLQCCSKQPWSANFSEEVSMAPKKCYLSLTQYQFF